MAKILLKNIGCLYSGNIKEPVLKANSILIEDGKIVEVGNDLSAADAKVIDAKGTTVMPGLIDSHTHPVVGEWTPRQGSMSWIDPYVRSGVTGLISVGETHIPGKPKNAEGMRALATLAKQTFDNVRVTTSRWVLFYTNRPLLIGSVAGLLVVIILIIVLIVRKKRRF